MGTRSDKKMTVFLDAGGILIDEAEIEEYSARTLVEVIGEHNPAYSRELYTSDLRVAIMVHCPDIPKYVIWQNCGKNLDLYRDILEKYLIRFQAERPRLKLHPEMKPVLADLAGDFDLAIAGQYGTEIVETLRENGVHDLFAHTFSQDDFATTKPDTRFYAELLEKSNAEPSRSIMVGDRIDKDIIPAKLIGMRSILVRTGIHRVQQPRTPDEIPDIELKSIEEIGAAVRRLAEQA
jgi:HAD superfamily hydrolase (TIGR01509 family)